MIRNIIFDMVGVLMRFDTESYIEEHHLSEADVAILRKEVFRSLEWAMQDRGSISTQEAERRICDRVPAHLCFAVHDLLYREGRKIVPVDGMRELLQDLKDRGFRLFVLSNTCVHWRSFWEEIQGHELFEDVVISAEVGLVKPQPEIFRLACERFGISAGESVFIDDTPANAEAAYYVGMRAVVFHGDTAELRRELETVLLGK